MAKKITFKDGQLHMDKPPTRTKKMTGTRFASVLGLNAWATPFEMWCALTRVYEKPFEETIYTNAGKVIEPKIVEYLRDVYFMEIQTPEDIYGKDYFRQTWGDFYPEVKVFGGMWDGINDDTVYEFKTTKRAEDWQHDIPIFYKLQAALYAHLKQIDNVVMTVSFLETNDYERPQDFKPSVENTKVYEFKMSEDYPDFEKQYIQPALQFWNDHVETGISPKYDEKKDAEILRALRTTHADATDDEIGDLLKEANNLYKEIADFDAIMKPKRDELKKLEAKIKDYMVGQFKEADTHVELTTDQMIWTVGKSTRNTFDAKALQADHPSIHENYMKQTETYTLRKKEVKID